MDTKTLELMRIPFATVLFLSSVYVLTQYSSALDSVLGTVLALVCIGVLVYSMVLFSHLDMPAKKY
jgi:hypothetical protein